MEILAGNDRTLDLFANIDDMVSGRTSANLKTVARQAHRAIYEVGLLCELLGRMTEGRFKNLLPALDNIVTQLDRVLPANREPIAVPLVVPIHEVRAGHTRLCGGKAALLGEAWWRMAGVEIPDGFVITTAAFAHFMNHNDLWPNVDRLVALHRARDREGLAEACHTLESAIFAAEIPAHVLGAIEDAFENMASKGVTSVAMRSSAIGEDSEASHAGQYHTELCVERGDLMSAYRKVLASAFSMPAVMYRADHGLSAAEIMMAVLCLRMLTPRCSGVLFTRDFHNPQADRVVIGATSGIASGIASGEQSAVEIVSDANANLLEGVDTLLGSDLARLVRAGRGLERTFGSPQDIEWAIEPDGCLYILQSRPMVFAKHSTKDAATVGEGLTPILSSGLCACSGTASGVVTHFRNSEDLGRVGQNTVLVARHSTPSLSSIMTSCAAIVTEVGSPTGHMAILAREYDVPCIVNAHGALDALLADTHVTVDAGRCCVFQGALPVPNRQTRLRPEPDGALSDSSRSPEHFERIAALVTPLRLTDPQSPLFAPEECRSLHDITRFVHEKTFGSIFDLAKVADMDSHHATELDIPLPFKVLLFDVGGGVDTELAKGAPVSRNHIRSVPLLAFMEGLLEPRIRWDQPRPVSSTGFLSVVGESMTGPPPEAQQIGRTSYVVISDEYMNFNTKAGYHFSTVDSFCSQVLNRNYIHFRFAGGGAAIERRTRRTRFLNLVLDALDFQSRQRGDILWARLDKWDAEVTRQRLMLLGRLTMITRQMDMLMDSDASPAFFAKAFLSDQIESF